MISIPDRHYLLYLLLPHPLKMAWLAPASHARLDAINRGFNTRVYSGTGATEYDRIHRYDAAEQHDYPVRQLIEMWGKWGYGHVLEVGAGSGYVTALLYRRAWHVLALEPVPDMQAMIRARCRREGLQDVAVLGGAALDVDRLVPEGSLDSVVVIQSLHHMHRRGDVFEALGRVLRPGGRLFLVEPHHNLRRVARLVRKYVKWYRPLAYRSDERNWATHDFCTRRELRALCRRGGFTDVRLSTFWYPYLRRLMPDPQRRFRLERALGHIPGVRHWAGVLALEARRAG